MSETPERTKTLGQWSAICAKSIREHLAPKGFAEIRTGVFKGAKKANIDFLSKESVDTAGRIAGGCVNHYRGRVKEFYKGKLSDAKKNLDDKRKEVDALRFFQIKQRGILNFEAEEIIASIACYEEILIELDYITIQ